MKKSVVIKKWTFFLFVLFASINYATAQCTGCQLTITVPSSATFNVTAGQVICIVGTGSFTGKLNNFNGNTLCIGTGVTYNPTNINYNGNWTIINNGTFSNVSGLNFNPGVSFTNGATGTVSFNNLIIGSGVNFVNSGNLATVNLTVNGGGNITLGGTTSISGQLGNNGTINVIGSIVAGSIVNNSSATIIGGTGDNCNSIRATGSFSNSGTFGGSGQNLFVGNTGGTITSPATTLTPAAPSGQPTGINLSRSGTTISGSFTATPSNGYFVLRAIAATAPTVTNPENFKSVSVGQTLGAWTVVAINNLQTTTTFSDNTGATCTNIHYRVYSFNSTGNCRVYNTSNVLAGTFNPIPSITSTTPASRCGTGTVALAATANGGTINWYANLTGGLSLGSGNSFTTPTITSSTTYYVDATTSDGCKTPTREAVVATVTNPPVNPTEITGTNSICSGTSTTLTATAGLGTYEWGTGTTVGTSPIAGTTNSITVSPTSTTTYWVRVKGTSPCGDSAGITTTVTVTLPVTAPTEIVVTSGSAISNCEGNMITLKAEGGTGPANSFEWGTGSIIGNNIIAGSSAARTFQVNNTETYWVRRKSTSPCNAEVTAGVTITVNVTAAPIAPSSISGTTTICSGTSTTLTATAGLGTYEWGTGATVGTSPIAGQTTNTLSTGNLTSTTTYWVRVKGTSPCGDSSGITTTVTVTPAAVAPTSITGTTSICSGTSTTLTATAGLGTYEWGTGATVGSNIIAGATSNTYTTPNLNSTTTYWVRVKGTSPCGDSAGISTTVTVNPSATAPTAITGIETSYCAGDAITLTASGGIGTTYQWGTGATIGNNIISGATAASISVSPSSTTTYWVRRQNTSPCSGVTSGVTKTITVLPTPGDPAVFGDNEWNVYGYSSGGNVNPTDYRGSYVQNLGSNLGMDTKLKWAANTSPSSASDWQGCSIPANSTYTFVHKRKGFPCGKYLLAYTYYDDDTVIIIKDATGVTFTINSPSYYNGGTGQSQAVNGTTKYALDANSTIEIRTTNTGVGESKLGIIFTGASTSIYNGTWNQDASYTDIEIQSDYSLPADITVCTCTVVDGKTFTVPANKTLTVIGNTTAVGTGKFIIENNGGFVQVNDNSTYTGVPASFTSKRQTQLVYRYDITYWSSPVEDFVLKNVSPLTLFDKFFSWNSTTQAWTPHKTNVAANLLEIMGTGKGYSIRAPQSFNIEGTAGATPQYHMAQFIGKPHNGVKQITVANGAANKWNMIGNPYPSALNIAEFLEVNKDVVDGTLYFWTHKTPVILNSPNPDFALYSATDYVAVNLSGNISNGNDAGVVASAPSGNSLGVNTGDDFLNVASGQAFFIKGKETGAISNQVTFNNKMRVRTGGENAQFFKPGVTTPVNNWQNTGKHRIWLNATTSQNDFNQTLVGYIQNATNGLDWGYDGQSLSNGAISIYSILNDQKLSIQARSLPFITQDEVPLGYSTTRTGTARITLDKVDGLFQGQDIYLEDNLLNVVHNLKNASYTFDIVSGTFNDRFVLRYLPSENLGTDLPTLDVSALVIYNLNNQISVKAKDLTIESVIIYDMQGRVLFTKNQVNAQEFTTQSLAVYKQVVLVKVITENKAEVVKKVILN